MRNLTILSVAAIAALGLAACTESKKDAEAEAKADALEQQAAQAPTESAETALNAEADRVEQQAGNADGGATTANTPNTSPSDTPANPNQ